MLITPETVTAGEMTPSRIIADIESLIRREGGRQYCATDSQLGFYRAQLCGVTAHLVPRSGIRRLYTHDTDIAVGLDGELRFMKGDVTSLRLWHRHLTAFRRAMRTGSSAIAA